MVAFWCVFLFFSNFSWPARWDVVVVLFAQRENDSSWRTVLGRNDDLTRDMMSLPLFLQPIGESIGTSMTALEDSLRTCMQFTGRSYGAPWRTLVNQGYRKQKNHDLYARSRDVRFSLPGWLFSCFYLLVKGGLIDFYPRLLVSITRNNFVQLTNQMADLKIVAIIGGFQRPSHPTENAMFRPIRSTSIAWFVNKKSCTTVDALGRHIYVGVNSYEVHKRIHK